mmetsp:Transcript_20651/g.53363  ORF Transcript_20651/g.53363 Transcript_20651/m.53363 type:complete len:309 (-) Transcript_20651:232-1158(-)
MAPDRVKDVPRVVPLLVLVLPLHEHSLVSMRNQIDEGHVFKCVQVRLQPLVIGGVAELTLPALHGAHNVDVALQIQRYVQKQILGVRPLLVVRPHHSHGRLGLVVAVRHEPRAFPLPAKGGRRQGTRARRHCTGTRAPQHITASARSRRATCSIVACGRCAGAEIARASVVLFSLANNPVKHSLTVTIPAIIIITCVVVLGTTVGIAVTFMGVIATGMTVAAVVVRTVRHAASAVDTAVVLVIMLVRIISDDVARGRPSRGGAVGGRSRCHAAQRGSWRRVVVVSIHISDGFESAHVPRHSRRVRPRR